MDNLRELGLKVKPKSKSKLRKAAHKLKDRYFENEVSVDVVMLLEKMQNDGLLEIEVLEPEDLGVDYAVAYPDIQTICIPSEVYVGAAENNGHHRFTIAHEIGHIELHEGQGEESDNHRIFEDSEWQADVFASELLIDSRFINEESNIESICNDFQVTEAAAVLRMLNDKKLKDKKVA